MSAKAESNGTNSSVAAILFAVFAVVCLAAFLAFRGSDIGQLPKLVGNLGGDPLFGDGSVDSLVGILSAAFILASWAGFGSGVLKIFPEIDSDRLQLVIRIAVGAAVSSLVWFFLGLVGGFDGWVAAVITGVGFTSFLVFKVWRTRKPEAQNSMSVVTLIVIATVLLLSVLSALAPPIAKDTLLYHLALPRAFIAQNSNAFIDGNIASYLALGNEMHSVWAMLLGNIVGPRAGEAAAGATSFLFFPLLLVVIYGWARELKISRDWALLATATVATVPSAYHVASSGYVDLSLALFVTLGIYSLTRWWKQPTVGAMALIAIFLGAALAIKLTTVFVIAAFALVILLRAREGKDSQAGSPPSGRILATGFAALLLAGAIASPWLLRTWKATGSPVFPFYMSILPGKANGWDVERSNLFQGMNSQYGGVDTDKLNYLTAPVRVSIAAQPEQPANYDGVLGVAFLIGLPLLIWALWKFDRPIDVKIGAGVAGIMYLFWLFSSEQLRYLLPIVPVLAIAIAASAETIGEKFRSIGRVAHCAFLAAAICGLLTCLAWFCQKAPLRIVLGGEARDQYLARNLDYYPYYQEINSNTSPDSKVWLINMRRDTYNIERPVFSDYLFEDWTLRKMLWESRSAQELRAKTAAMGVKYVLTRHDFLFDYDRSTLVDDKKPRAENEAKLKIAKEFILDTANTIKADNKFSLIKVFSEQ